MLANGWATPVPVAAIPCMNNLAAEDELSANARISEATVSAEATPPMRLPGVQRHVASKHILITYSSQAFKNKAWKGGKQQWCAICNQEKTAYFCSECGPGVPVHGLRSSYKTCLRDHQRDPSYRSALPRPRRVKAKSVMI